MLFLLKKITTKETTEMPLTSEGTVFLVEGSGMGVRTFHAANRHSSESGMLGFVYVF